MTNNSLKILIFFLLLLNLNHLSASPSQPVDLRILVDISGDARVSFPEQQHLDALSLLVQRLPEGSRAGVWTYGKFVNYLVKQGRVSELWRRNASVQIGKIRSVATKRNLASVLEKASYDAAKSDPGFHRIILLLSSGGIYLSDSDNENTESRARVLDKILPKLREAGFTIHTLASSNADSGLLKTLSKETNGFAFTLDTGSDIYPAIMSLAQWLSPGYGVELENQRFAIDAKVKEFTALLTHAKGEELTIQIPSGTLITAADQTENVSWILGERYSIVRVLSPELGQWRILETVGEQSQIYLESTPELVIKQLADNYVSGQNIDLRVALLDSGEDLDFGDPRVTIELKGDESFSHELEQDPHANNEYVGQFNGFHSAGSYTVKVKAESLDYTRVVTQAFQVYDLLSIDVTTQQGDQTTDYLLTMSPTDSDLDLRNSTIIATITDASGEWSVRTVKQNEAGVWELLLEDDGQSSQYTVDLDFKGVTGSGREIHYQPKPLQIEVKRETAPAEIIADPVADPVSEPELAESDVQVPATPASEKPRLLILIGGICFVLSAGLILFYYLKRSGKKQEDLGEEGVDSDDPRLTITDNATPEALETAAIDEPEPLQEEEQADEEQKEEPEPVIEADDYEAADDLDVEILFDEPSEEPGSSEQEIVDVPGQPEQSESESALPEFEEGVSEGGVEIDQDLAEETELADEWSQLDAESNIPSTADEQASDRIDIEFDFNDEEDKDKPK